MTTVFVRRHIPGVIGILLLVSTESLAQHGGGASGGSAGHRHQQTHATTASGPISGPFGLSVYGSFMHMVQTQDYGAKVQLNSILQSGATEAVGAASGLRGEITVIDGKLLLTYGAPCPSCGRAGMEHATLLAAAKVPAWQPAIVLPEDLAGAALDAYIIERARSVGLDVTKPFPLRLVGTLTQVKMHVIRAANVNFKGHGSGHPMAEQENTTANRIDGEIVAFFAPPSAQGTITHPREPFHYHWVDAARTRTAHLDEFGLSKGARLLLPKQ